MSEKYARKSHLQHLVLNWIENKINLTGLLLWLAKWWKVHKAYILHAVIGIHEYIYSHSTPEFTFKKYIYLHLLVYFLFTIIFADIFEMSWFTPTCFIHYYYMASSASGQDEPNRALWLATRVGKMEPSCPLGTTRCIPQAKFPQKPYNKSFIDQVCSVKMAGYWPRSFFASLWTLTSSQSIHTQKKNLANIQPSWPRTSWSITHTHSWSK